MSIIKQIHTGEVIKRKRNQKQISSKRIADRIDMEHELYLRKEQGLEPFTETELEKVEKAIVQ